MQLSGMVQQVNMRVVVCFFTILVCSCAAINNGVEHTGRFLDGSVFALKTDMRWRPLDDAKLDVRLITHRKGARALYFTHEQLPYLTFYGTLPDVRGDFFLTEMHFLAASYGGWIEYTCTTAGKGRLRRFGDDNAAFTIITGIERGEINSGKIRLEATRLSGERALEALRNRDERIRFLADWMHNDGKQIFSVPNFTSQGFSGEKAFETFWRPRLLPPQRNKAAHALLKNELRTLLESGALEADLNEAAIWLYMEYDWEKINTVLRNEVLLSAVY